MTRGANLIVEVGGVDPAVGQLLNRQSNAQACAAGALDFMHLALGEADTLTHLGKGHSEIAPEVGDGEGDG